VSAEKGSGVLMYATERDWSPEVVELNAGRVLFLLVGDHCENF